MVVEYRGGPDPLRKGRMPLVGSPDGSGGASVRKRRLAVVVVEKRRSNSGYQELEMGYSQCFPAPKHLKAKKIDDGVYTWYFDFPRFGNVLTMNS